MPEAAPPTSDDPMPEAAPPPSSPSWFIASSDLTTLGEKRAQEKRVHTVLESLQQVFPTLDSGTLRAAIAAGGDLSSVVNRLLEAQQPSHSADAPPSRAVPPLPQQQQMMEQMEQDDDAECRLSAEMESSGLGDAAVAGSARASRLSDDANLAAALADETAENLAAQSVAQLSNGTLRITASLTRTVNELEERGMMLSEKIVTKFVIDVEQLGFKWEVRATMVHCSHYTPPTTPYSRPTTCDALVATHCRSRVATPNSPNFTSCWSCSGAICRRPWRGSSVEALGGSIWRSTPE